MRSSFISNSSHDNILLENTYEASHSIFSTFIKSLLSLASFSLESYILFTHYPVTWDHIASVNLFHLFEHLKPPTKVYSHLHDLFGSKHSSGFISQIIWYKSSQDFNSIYIS